MTELASLRGGNDRGQYEIDPGKVAARLAERLLEGRALRIPEPPGPEPLDLGVTGTGSIYFHRRAIRRRRSRTLQHA